MTKKNQQKTTPEAPQVMVLSPMVNQQVTPTTKLLPRKSAPSVLGPGAGSGSGSGSVSVSGSEKGSGSGSDKD